MQHPSTLLIGEKLCSRHWLYIETSKKTKRTQSYVDIETNQFLCNRTTYLPNLVDRYQRTPTMSGNRGPEIEGGLRRGRFSAQKVKLQALAESTTVICQEGSYTDVNGNEHNITDAISAAVEGTRVYTREQTEEKMDCWDTTTHSEGVQGGPQIEVTSETTQEATIRLFNDAEPDVALLNFASAKNPCGGFLSGARAQEEDLARSSALHTCLTTQTVFKEYYSANRRRNNRRCGNVLYTDALVYTPGCPFFRVSESLVAPFVPSVLSAPSPNYGAMRSHSRLSDEEFKSVYQRRARYILGVLREHKHRCLVLGAWGCGVFRVDPTMAATVWRGLLVGEFATAFDRIVFAVYDGPQEAPGPRFQIFQQVMSPGDSTELAPGASTAMQEP